MAATFTLTGSMPLGNGMMLVVGEAVLSSSYAQTGEVLNLSSYLKSSSSPVVMLQCQDPTYALYHDGGTAAAGTIQVYALANGSEASAEADLSSVYVNVVAFGQQVGTS